MCVVHILTKSSDAAYHPGFNIGKFEAILVLSFNNRFDKLANISSCFLHNYKNYTQMGQQF